MKKSEIKKLEESLYNQLTSIMEGQYNLSEDASNPVLKKYDLKKIYSFLQGQRFDTHQLSDVDYISEKVHHYFENNNPPKQIPDSDAVLIATKFAQFEKFKRGEAPSTVDEISTTANGGSYNTPNAFNKDSGAGGAASFSLKTSAPFGTIAPKTHKVFRPMTSTKPINEQFARRPNEQEWKTAEKFAASQGGSLGSIGVILKDSSINVIVDMPDRSEKRFRISQAGEMIERNPLYEASYKDFKTDESLTPRQKVNEALININRQIREVNRQLTHVSKFKTEMNVGKDAYWKRTFEAMDKISARLIEVVGKFSALKKEAVAAPQPIQEATTYPSKGYGSTSDGYVFNDSGTKDEVEEMVATLKKNGVRAKVNAGSFIGHKTLAIHRDDLNKASALMTKYYRNNFASDQVAKLITLSKNSIS